LPVRINAKGKHMSIVRFTGFWRHFFFRRGPNLGEARGWLLGGATFRDGFFGPPGVETKSNERDFF